MEPLLSDTQQVKRLAERLAHLQGVRRFSGETHDEAWALATALADLEATFRSVVEDLLPSLVLNTLGDDQLHAVLLDLGEEFRHVRYHLESSRFYSYLAGSNE